MSEVGDNSGNVAFDQKVLHAFAQDVLVRTGLSADDADFVAGTLVRSSLRGIDTHGVQLLPNLASRILDRTIDPTKRGAVVSDALTTAVVDGQNGVGQLVTRLACDVAVVKAQSSGLGLVTVRNGNHFGAGATWAERIVDAGLIGVAGCNTYPVMAPWGGREARLGTNPLAVAVPCGNRGPWLLDMATSTVAMSRLLVAHRKGEKTIPAGWALDANGESTTDVRSALKGGTLLPMGGAKGAGIAMLIDILAGVLSGGMFGNDVQPFNLASAETHTSAFILAIDVSAFMPIEQFRSRMDAFIEMMCSAAPASGFDRVVAPGQMEAATAARRQSEGIPISPSLLEALQATASKVDAKPLAKH